MDIVERLREVGWSLVMGKIHAERSEAADEIERLREENKWMQYYLPENIGFVRCSEGKDHFDFEVFYKPLEGGE